MLKLTYKLQLNHSKDIDTNSVDAETIYKWYKCGSTVTVTRIVDYGTRIVETSHDYRKHATNGKDTRKAVKDTADNKHSVIYGRHTTDGLKLERATVGGDKDRQLERAYSHDGDRLTLGYIAHIKDVNSGRNKSRKRSIYDRAIKSAKHYYKGNAKETARAVSRIESIYAFMSNWDDGDTYKIGGEKLSQDYPRAKRVKGLALGNTYDI